MTWFVFAERAVIDARRSILLPDDTDPVTVAAAMNPAMSCWLALCRRTQFQAGSDVLILGATGNAGQLAVQVAKLLGAARIVAAGRDADRLAALPALGATDTVPLDGDAGAHRHRPAYEHIHPPMTETFTVTSPPALPRGAVTRAARTGWRPATGRRAGRPRRSTSRPA